MLIEQAAVSFNLWFNISLTEQGYKEVKKSVKHPIKIAITGKIGSGKTFVSKFLKELGYKVFESDKEVAKIFGDLITQKKIKKFFL